MVLVGRRCAAASRFAFSTGNVLQQTGVRGLSDRQPPFGKPLHLPRSALAEHQNLYMTPRLKLYFSLVSTMGLSVIS